jgi:hypothetical protein
MSNANEIDLSATGATAAARVRSIVCRVYGALVALVGLAGVQLFGFFVWLDAVRGMVAVRLSMYNSSSTFDITPLPAWDAPFSLACSAAVVVLGVLVFRQSVAAAIALVAVPAAYFAPYFVVGSPGNTMLQNIMLVAVPSAVLLVPTAVVVIADRAAARGRPARRYAMAG